MVKKRKRGNNGRRRLTTAMMSDKYKIDGVSLLDYKEYWRREEEDDTEYINCVDVSGRLKSFWESKWGERSIVKQCVEASKDLGTADWEEFDLVKWSDVGRKKCEYFRPKELPRNLNEEVLEWDDKELNMDEDTVVIVGGSDGSAKDGATGWGYVFMDEDVLSKSQEEVDERIEKLKDNRYYIEGEYEGRLRIWAGADAHAMRSTIYHAELEGCLQLVKSIKERGEEGQLWEEGKKKEAELKIDNLSVVNQVTGRERTQDAWANGKLEEIYELMEAAEDVEWKVRKIGGHTGDELNEISDRLAKLGMQGSLWIREESDCDWVKARKVGMDMRFRTTMKKEAKRQAIENTQRELNRYLGDGRVHSGRKCFGKRWRRWRKQEMKELTVEEWSKLMRLRSGYVRVGGSCKFSRSVSDKKCTCGKKKTEKHINYCCPLFRKMRKKTEKKIKKMFKKKRKYGMMRKGIGWIGRAFCFR